MDRTAPGAPPDGGSVTVNLRMPPSVARRWREMATELGLTRSELFRVVLGQLADDGLSEEYAERARILRSARVVR